MKRADATLFELQPPSNPLADRACQLMQSGHALAAAAEGVTLHHIALFLVMWVPGASVALDSEGLAALTPWRVLRVCLGCR